MSAVLKQSV